MQALVSYDASDPTSGFVEVITLAGIPRPLGYRFLGVRSGPVAMISAQSQVCERIFDKMTGLPTLPWLRGSIYLLSQEIMDSLDAQILQSSLADIDFDEAISLPFVGTTETDLTAAVNEGYWTALRLCARLGIIEGRGVNSYSGPRAYCECGVFGPVA